LGFVYLEQQNRLLISYSKMDRETKYMMLSKSVFDRMMISV
jgi:hypothetical protein